MKEVIERRAAFRELHRTGCFVIPNPWDIGTAKYLQYLGFKALATTSAGLAFSQGLPDADWAVPLAMALGHIREIVQATELPVNADFEGGYAREPEGVEKNARLCIDTGVAGFSIEDSTGDQQDPLFEMSLATERIRAARRAIDGSGANVLLTGRAECYLVGHPHAFQESLRRLQAYAEAGADVLYAPGITKPDEIRAMVEAVRPKPVNVLMGSNIGLRVADLAEMGVRRISVGSSLARAAWSGFARAAREIAEQGTFGGFEHILPYSEINDFFRDCTTTPASTG
ncbi:MAG TPA: isocitrate lyase/phosphoenolpyruvate mutase family protein [Bryobacteraceae bacterium]|jgi:2-methylisocitrate lyase-like PEP mutase family enzyme|nr:isocitrate lyase/phosphoenolpyruvate mutase family protein [Bryobacteraceae bacterium]